MKNLFDQQVKVLAQVNADCMVVQLVEIQPSVTLIRRLQLNGELISQSKPLYMDFVSLQEARELFAEQMHCGGIPVDGC